MKKKYILFGILFLVMLLTMSLSLVYVYVEPFKDPEGLYTKERIQKLLSSETLIYDESGQVVLGSAVEGEARQYMPLTEIPPFFAHAVLAAEDHEFYSHHGFDLVSIFRATWVNWQANRVVQGGSTITQQTAKNLFGRSQRDFESKWRELGQALMLEHYFDKNQILEFYLNQFQVAHKGRGLRRAAQYFFGRAPHELNRGELLFIGASLKGPFLFDPHIAHDSLELQQKLNRANHRMRWVLSRMVQNEMIAEVDSSQIMQSPLRWVKPRDPLNQSQLIKFVTEEMGDSSIQSTLDLQEIHTWQSSGLKIITSIDASQQNQLNDLNNFSDSSNALVVIDHKVKAIRIGLNYPQNFDEFWRFKTKQDAWLNRLALLKYWIETEQHPLDSIFTSKGVMSFFGALNLHNRSNLKYAYDQISEKWSEDQWTQQLENCGVRKVGEDWGETFSNVQRLGLVNKSQAEKDQLETRISARIIADEIELEGDVSTATWIRNFLYQNMDWKLLSMRLEVDPSGLVPPLIKVDSTASKRLALSRIFQHKLVSDMNFAWDDFQTIRELPKLGKYLRSCGLNKAHKHLNLSGRAQFERMISDTLSLADFSGAMFGERLSPSIIETILSPKGDTIWKRPALLKLSSPVDKVPGWTMYCKDKMTWSDSAGFHRCQWGKSQTIFVIQEKLFSRYGFILSSKDLLEGTFGNEYMANFSVPVKISWVPLIPNTLLPDINRGKLFPWIGPKL